MTRSTEAVAAHAPRRRLPGSLRVARIAELAYALSALVLLLFVPFADWRTVLPLLVEGVLAIVLCFGLGRARRWAWIVAVVMAVYVIARSLAAAGRLLSLGTATSAVALAAWTGIGWIVLLQAIVLAACIVAWRRGDLRARSGDG